MSDRIVESLNEMKQIYLESVSGQVISERDEYLQYLEEKYKKNKKESEVEKKEGNKEGAEDNEDEGKESGEDNGDEDKPKRWWDDDGDGVGYEKGEVGGKFKKNKKVNESMSDWRHELYEKVGDVESDIKNSKQTQLKERSGLTNKVDINPNVNIGESVELPEEHIQEVVDIAAQYFYEQGLNEEGLQMVIEDLGVDKFIEYVFCISEDFILTEARKAKRVPTTPEQKAKKIAEIKAGIEAREKKPTAAQKVTVDKGNKSVSAAVSSQTAPKGFEKAAQNVKNFVTSPDTKQTLQTALSDVVRRGKRDLARTVLSGVEAGKAAKEARKRGASGAGAAGAAAGTFLRGITKGVTAKGVREEIESFLLEKAESEQQQKLFGLALSVKRGETPRSEVSQQVLDIVDSMSEDQIRKYAKTSHKGLPKKVEN
jgi:hypothetical protein